MRMPAKMRTLSCDGARDGSVGRMPPALPATYLPHHRRRVFLAALLAAFAALMLLAAGASADAITPESGAGSPNAESIDSLYKLILYIAIVVFAGVQGTLVYSLFKFRARKGAVAAQIHGNTRLEVGFTICAALVLVVLTAITFAKVSDIRNPPKSGPDGLQLASGVVTADDSRKKLPPDGKSLNIAVNGQQYVWRYTYPESEQNVFSYEEMVVPLNTTITLDITAQDVAHAWWIPKLGGKMDALPGYTNYTWFKVTKPGVYTGQCAELCGRNHANMTARVRAVPVDEYKRWVQQQRRDIDAANAAAQQARQQQAPAQTQAQ